MEATVRFDRSVGDQIPRLIIAIALTKKSGEDHGRGAGEDEVGEAVEEAETARN